MLGVPSCVQTIMRIIQSASVGSLAAAGPAKAAANIKTSMEMRVMTDREAAGSIPRHPLSSAVPHLRPSQPQRDLARLLERSPALHPFRLLALVALAPELRPLLAGRHLAFGFGGLPLSAASAHAAHHGGAPAGRLRCRFGGGRRRSGFRLRRLGGGRRGG